MAFVMPRLRSAALLVGALLATLTLTACEETGVDAVVTNIVDGDTIDVEYDGQEQRVRLLNIDTPETVDPDVDPECMGPEATQFLESRIPPGTEVRLEADEEPKDQYDRYLAGVYLDDTLINAEIARAGLGTAVLYEPNDRFYDQVLAAQGEAETAKRGLYDTTTECTLPAQLAATTAGAETVTGTRPGEGASLEDLESYGEELAAAVGTAAILAKLLDGDRSHFPLMAFTDVDLTRMRTSVQTTSDELHQLRRDNDNAIEAEEERIAEERRLAEEERIAEEEARRQAAEEAAAEQRAAEEAEQRAAEEAEREAAEREAAAAAERERDQQAEQPQDPSSSGSSGSSSSSEPSGSSGGYDGYTGCRAYSGHPFNAVDEQGRPYAKIDC